MRFYIGILMQYFNLNFDMLILWLFIILVWFIIYKSIIIKVNLDYKIYKSKLNWVFIVIYIILFFLLIIIFRFIAWSSPIDLKVIINKINKVIIQYGFILSLLTISVILLSYILLFKIRKFLIKECKKRYIYLNHTNSEFNNMCQYLQSLELKWLLSKLYILKIDPLLKRHPTLSKNIYYFYRKIFYNIFFIILLLLFFLDIYINKYKIILLTYYLPFFIFFKMVNAISDFLACTSSLLNRVIFDQYYMKHYFRYIELTSGEEQCIKEYLNNGLQIVLKDFYDDTSEHITMKKRCFRISKLHWSNGIDTWENTEYEQEILKGPESDLELIPKEDEFKD